MSFGERLQEVRRNNGMTQEAFAEQLNVSRQAVSKWESSKGYPELEKILYICNRYHVSMNELFAEEVPAAQPDCPPSPPQTLGRRTLKMALDDFFNNLSPLNKWIGFGSLLAIALLIPLCMKFIIRGGPDDMLIMLWVAAIVLFGIVEAATAGLVSIWFVAGAAVALLTAILGLGIWVQITVFVLASAAALALTRPLMKKLANTKAIPTNADRVLGVVCKVTETIDNENSTGAVYVDGKTWSARSADDSILPVGVQVTVESMEGVKLFVKKYEK